jgi:hypothetical protein
MMTMLDEVLRQCGFIGTLIIGGPDPEMPDSIISMVFQSGKTSTGLTFSDAYPKTKTALTNSFNAFALKCLSKCSRASECVNMLTNQCMIVIDKPTTTTGADSMSQQLGNPISTPNASTTNGEGGRNDMNVDSNEPEGPATGSSDGSLGMDVDMDQIGGGSSETRSKIHNDVRTAEAATGECATTGEHGSNVPEGPASGSSDDSLRMDVDMDRIGEGSGETGSEIGDEVRIAEAVTGERTATGEHGSNEKLGTTAGDGCGSETAQGEDVAKGQPAGAKVPAKPKPIRYLDGKQVSEYEWERNEQIERNKKALTELGLGDAGEKLFGKKGKRKGKENQIAPAKENKRLPWANVEKRALRSSGKAVPDM